MRYHSAANSSPLPERGGESMRGFFWCGLFLSLLLIVGTMSVATAQPVEEAPRERVFDFDEEAIEGEILTPDESLIEASARLERGSLIKIRLDFIDEIVRSAEEL